jgi:phosphatidylglycerophosphate synthase
MKRGYVFGIFSEEEEKKYERLRNIRDRVYEPVCAMLARISLPPDFLSYAGFLMVVPFILFFPVNPWFSFLALLFNVFFDSLDGSYARYLKKETFRGAMTDLACDYGSFLIFFLTILYYGQMSFFWAWLYLINYAAMFGLLIYCNSRKISFFTVIKSKYYFYGIFLLMLISGRNFFDLFLVFFSVYMIVTNLLLAYKIKCSRS